MIAFYPTWQTPSGNITRIIENQAISIKLNAVHSAQFMGSYFNSPNQVNLAGNNIDLRSISNVYVNNKSVSYTIEADNIVLSNTVVSKSDIISINTTKPLTYSTLYDSLPSGLSLSNSGLISGTLKSSKSVVPQTYTFATRISDGIYVRDREFSIIVDISNAVSSPPSWGKLPTEKIKSGNPPFPYIPIGSSTRSKLFEFQLDIFEPTNLPPTFEIQRFFNPQLSSPFNMIPSGLSINSSGLIEGIVAPDVRFGDYYFNILMKDFFGNLITSGNAKNALTFKITIEPTNTSLQPFRLIIWNTPAGFLTSLYEGQAFPLSINAICTTGESVSYSLVKNTQLPPGLKLNSSNGNIEGILLHASDTNVTYDFTVRANVLNVFEDRNFSITVLSKYKSSQYLDFYFKIRMLDATYMTKYYSEIIQTSDYFRRDDINFGISNSNSLQIYLIGGLNGSADTVGSYIRSSPTNGPMRLILGDHKVANVIINGKVIYEVLYREVHDSMAGAGGYIIDNNPVKDPLLYPESDATNPVYINPNSINNIRNEFALGLKFPSDNPKFLGINSAENLPIWMSCPQSNNDPSTAIGYIPAIVVAYLLPGTGKQVLDKIAVRYKPDESPIDPSDPIRRGHVVLFDQYEVIFESISIKTSFDLDLTSFDNGLIFDYYPYNDSKLFRIKDTIDTGNNNG